MVKYALPFVIGIFASNPCLAQQQNPVFYGPGRLFTISSDGETVTRRIDTAIVSTASFPTNLLPSGWTSQTDNSGSINAGLPQTGWFTRAGDPRPYGGAEYSAVYSYGDPLPTGSSLDWIQVVTTNYPQTAGTTSPYLDNNGSKTSPYYPNKTFPSANEIGFYDFSGRPDLGGKDQVNWNAQLYPVLKTGNSIVIQNGTSWGFTIMKAMVGTLSGGFNGGFSTFSWGGGDDPSWLQFSSAGVFNTSAGINFKLGTLIFHNGVISGNFPEFNSTILSNNISFSNVPELNFVADVNISIDNTFNIGSPAQNADSVTLSGFNYKFNVLEGATSSVDLYASLTPSLSLGSVFTFSALDSTSSSSASQDTGPSYEFAFTGFGTPTSGGFISSAVPEPATWAMMICGFGMIGSAMRRRPHRFCLHLA